MEKVFELYETANTQIVVKKSKFIGETFKVKNENEINDYIAMTKKKYYDARHHCFAYCLGTENEIRASDDGEPSGTAGRPILGVILGESMRNTLVIVTRYFGGTLLGTGGLTRAYKDAAKEAIKSSVKIEVRNGYKSQITLGYELTGKAENILKESGVVMLEPDYQEKATYNFIATDEEIKRLNALFGEISLGSLEINAGDLQVYGLLEGRVIWL